MTRAGRNFDQKVVVRGDQTFVERRYSGHGGTPRHGSARHGSARHEHSYEGSRYYHRRAYGHHHYDCYVRHWTYNPWFWGFFFAPFAAPWHYTWVWVGTPWYASWGWYYQPYPVYQAPSYWVTDYVISRSLEEEYDRGYAAGQQAAAGQPTPVGAPISEPLKEELRQQVDQTAKAYQAEQAMALEQALQKPGYLFVVDTTLSVTNVDGTVCALSGGDIIKPAAAVDPTVPVAQMRVVTSKGDECPAGSTVAVSLTDLQEMLNSFGQKVDDGMNELQKTKNPQAVTPQ
jgi:hypothetical protein